jgi:RNA polymerase sigma factor (sigma-70 family)
MSHHPDTRLTLLVKLRDRGNDQAWNEFDGIYRGYVIGVLRNLAIDEKLRDDVTQEVMLTCWRKLSDFDYDANKGRFRGWLATIVRNAAYDHVRQDARRRNREAKATLPEVSTAEVTRLAEEEWQRHVMELAWTRVRPSLAANVRSAFELYLSGKAATEIAAALELEVNTVHVYRKRVRTRLMKEALHIDEEYG